MPGKNAAEIVVGADGSIYAAPLGTGEPAGIGTALNAAFADLGFVSEEGAQLTAAMSAEEIRVWQSYYPVRRVVATRDFTLAFALAQWNADTVPLFFGGGTVAAGQFTPPDPSVIDERMMALEWADGTRDFRIVVQRGMVTEQDATQLVRTDASWLPITFGALGTTAAQPWYLQTDDPAFA